MERNFGGWSGARRGWARLSGISESTFAFVPGRAELSVEEHVQIVDLIRSGADPLEITGACGLASLDNTLGNRGKGWVEGRHTCLSF